MMILIKMLQRPDDKYDLEELTMMLVLVTRMSFYYYCR
jgi:hypothetical protein